MLKSVKDLKSSAKKLCLVITISFLFYAPSLFGNHIDVGTARDVANNWYEYWSSHESEIGNEFTKEYNGHPSFYVFNFEQGGFVIVPADDAAVPVLGYSIHSKAPEEIFHPAISDWMDYYHHQLDMIINRHLSNDETSCIWQDVLDKDFSCFDEGRDVPALLSTEWNQNWPYNELCPVDASGPGGHAYAGCVATAMGQVMKYHNHPSPGVSSHSYDHATYGTLSADFASTYYDWSNMPDYIYASNNAIATLLYHAGVAVEMDYGPYGSGAGIISATLALRSVFNYDTSLQLVFKDDSTTTYWENLLKNELDNDRPMLYGGVNPTSGAGHAFVCDGYEGTNYFHFNWGWSGSYNGNYYLDNLNPGTHNYTNEQQTIVGITPNISAYVHPLLSGFEYTKNDWIIIDNDGDGNNWKTYLVPHTGEKCIGIHANAYGTDDWLISVAIDFPDNAMNEFSFWARSWSSANQDFNVKLSTTGNNISDFTTTLGTVTATPVSYTQYNYDLSSYSGQTIYLAVQCVTSGNSSYLMADDFCVTTNCYPVADAENDETFNAGSIVNLDGSDSYDRYGNTINYDWTAPSCITLSDPASAYPYFTAPNVSDSTDYKFTLIVNDGILYSDPDTVIVTVIPYGVDDDIQQCITHIGQNYPNPFREHTNISFGIAKQGHVTLDVYNVKGEKIKRLVNEILQATDYNIEWNGIDDNGNSVANGMYFYRISFEDTNIIPNKMILMK